MFMDGELTLCIIIIRIVLERFLLLIEAYLFDIRIRTEYSTEAAFAEQCEFMKQLTPAERTQSALLDAIVRLHDRIEEARTKDPTAAADAKRELALLRQRILRGENAAKTHTLMRFFESCTFMDC